MHRSREGGLNLFELLFLFLILYLGFTAAAWAKNHYGWIAGIAGFAFGFLILPLAFAFLGRVMDLAFEGRPRFPTCRNGKCRSDDYKVVSLKGRNRWIGTRYGLFCKCGTKYEKKGRRFLEVLPDGSRRPFMIWRSFRGWFADDAGETRFAANTLELVFAAGDAEGAEFRFPGLCVLSVLCG